MFCTHVAWACLVCLRLCKEEDGGFVDRPRRSDGTAGQMDGEAGWWTTSGNIGLPPLARVMGVGRQQRLCKEEGLFSRVFVGVWDYVNQLPYVWYYAGVESSFQQASPRGCLIFSVSGPCDLLFLLPL